MRIRIEGDPAGDGRGESTEKLRDRAASALGSVMRQQRGLAPLRLVTLEFGHGDDAPAPVAREPRPAPAAPPPQDSSDMRHLLRKPLRECAKLCLSPGPMGSIEHAICRFGVADRVYNTWNLRSIDARPRLALGFGGPSGTGKTIAAHYVAVRLGRPLIEVSYADVSSEYVGRGAKNLAAVFALAAKEKAVLFFDESDSLLSRRIADPGDGATGSANAMRNQMLTLMENTPVLSIFASNLTTAYDPAFLSRLIMVPFALPDEAMRARIWSAHLPLELPLEVSVDAALLAARWPGLNGRQICRIVIEAAFRAAVDDRETLTLADFDWAASQVVKSD